MSVAVAEQAFRLEDYLLSIPERLLEIPEGRRELTRFDPLLFALLYLPHHLRGEATGGDITLNQFHLALVEQAKTWVKPLGRMAEARDAYVAPRECGKSTWLFTILPLWAAAHEHVQFIAAFADSAAQAEQHLATFRNELDSNELLGIDFPELCTPAKRTRVSRQLADNRGQIQQANGAIFMARGVDSSTLGMKVGALRPQLIILDDIEPGEGGYSAYQMSKRLMTLQDVILPLNAFARVVLSGTVTMQGSIVHQLVSSVTRPEETPDWVDADSWRVHYFPAILEDAQGRERSIWPEKWPLDELQSLRGTRSFQKNFMNDPVDEDGIFWSREDIPFGKPEEYGNTLLSIDPAVTTRQTSDYTGLVVVSKGLGEDSDKVYVRHASHVRMSPAQLREHVLELLSLHPEVGLVVIETNQGGDTWKQVLHGLPVKLKTVHQKVSKELRAQRALNHYQRGRVFHTKTLPTLEEEMLAFPRALHDDVVDAMTTGVNYLLDARPKKKSTARQKSYL